MPTVTLFDNFNAKNSTQEEVAETFVSNEDFFSIAKNNHTFVLGPRGCGKTTMFKMLTTSALSTWNPPTVREYDLKNSIPFLAIYIPSDELWKDQLTSITSGLKNEPDLVKFVTNALNSNNIFTNFCNGIKNHLKYLDIDDKKSKEFAFSQLLIKSWEIEDCAPTLSSIKLALGERRKYLIQKVKKFVFQRRHGMQKGTEFEEYFFSDFLTSLRIAMTAYENVFNEEQEIKWALCFDELELVSKDFFESLIHKLRIAPPNIVFKLSTSPLAEFTNSMAQVLHDYEVVKMWPFSHAEEKRYAQFCEGIATERIRVYRQKKGLKKNISIDFGELFGSLDYSIHALREFSFAIDRTVKDGQPNSLAWHVFKELASKDNGLVEEMKKRGIDKLNPIPGSKLHYDSFIRKTKEIVINRLLFSKFKDSEFFAQQSRKEYPIYYGKETIFKICEGNPRFIINIINDILIKTEKYMDMDRLVFAPEEQATVIKNVSTRFSAMLNTYPTSVVFNQRTVDLEWLIGKVGSYFEDQVNYGTFKINPANSFFFKDNIAKQVLDLVSIGVSLGAFVKVDTNEDDLDIYHSRYRLSYLLHPRFKLPLRLYGNVKLNTILSGENKQHQLKIE